MRILKLNTREADAEIKQIRKNLSHSPFIDAIPKPIDSVARYPANVLGLPEAYAWKFSHNNERDDSRGSYHDKWVSGSSGRRWSTLVTNVAEVIYNESRGHRQMARYAVAWAIRNRATINMNGCDIYIGSQSDPEVTECREATPDGKSDDLAYIAKNYSCVVHGGTTSVGMEQSEMDDTHVDMADLESSGIIWQAFYVIKGWVSDPTSPYSLITKYPENDYYVGFPDGAQEWRKENYCSDAHHCKTRKGNIGGSHYDPGIECPDINQESDNLSDSDEDIFFWGRKY
ncbi:MAG: hypothetical protein HRU19_33100 [Pseudobacteriovorax sp.]|nr:hypothetical protein [Pseudobacteriovorax sp.]